MIPFLSKRYAQVVKVPNFIIIVIVVVKFTLGCWETHFTARTEPYKEIMNVETRTANKSGKKLEQSEINCVGFQDTGN